PVPRRHRRRRAGLRARRRGRGSSRDRGPGAVQARVARALRAGRAHRVLHGRAGRRAALEPLALAREPRRHGRQPGPRAGDRQHRLAGGGVPRRDAPRVRDEPARLPRGDAHPRPRDRGDRPARRSRAVPRVGPGRRRPRLLRVRRERGGERGGDGDASGRDGAARGRPGRRVRRGRRLVRRRAVVARAQPDGEPLRAAARPRRRGDPAPVHALSERRHAPV
ncbi:MAG: tolB protein precursor, periplasmic protein involved in the tonb-independent uptake of group A colicins, partial [uncultured Gemmatimonadaceae bacterium]